MQLLLSGLLKAAAGLEQHSQDAGDLVNLLFNSSDNVSKEHQTDDATLAVVGWFGWLFADRLSGFSVGIVDNMLASSIFIRSLTRFFAEEFGWGTEIRLEEQQRLSEIADEWFDSI